MRAFIIAGRELRSLFYAPLAWAVLAVIVAISAYIFLVQIEFFESVEARLATLNGAPGLTQIVANPLLRAAAIIMLLVVPVLAMRSFSEERRSGSLVLLMSAPVSIIDIVLGKYLGLMAFLLLAVALIAAMPLTLLIGATLDYGLFASGVLGLVLLVGAFAAAGLFLSSISRNPTVAAISSFGLLLLLWILDWSSATGAEGPVTVLRHLALLPHYDALLKGEFASNDVAYYLLFIVAFLGLTVFRLDFLRLRS